MIPTRGERNNNPGNIRKGPTPYRGEVNGADADFETFDTPIDGLRAIAVTMRAYKKLHGLDTVRGLISRYAPGTENDTDAYIDDVAQRVGVGPDDILDLSDQSLMARLVAAIVHHENGRVNYSSAEIFQAVTA